MPSQPYPELDTVVAAVCAALFSPPTDSSAAPRQPIACQVDKSSIRYLPWSTLYFLTLTARQHAPAQQIVAKIVHFPDQEAASVSWESEELLIRGQREYHAMTRVFEHFQADTAPALSATRPRAYVRAINAIVMDYIDGESLYAGYARPSSLRTEEGTRTAQHLVGLSGQWLKHLHTLSTDNADPARIFGPRDTVANLLTEAETLHQRGVRLPDSAQWNYILNQLERVQSSERVWTHGDFHMGNMFVLPHQESGTEVKQSVLALDIALERIDTPYWDLGKFVADMQTRRARILQWGLRPSSHQLAGLRAAFLEGYGQPIDPVLLAIYEGYFIVQKWQESLDALASTLHGPRALIGTTLRRSVINPTFSRILTGWMRTTLQAFDA